VFNDFSLESRMTKVCRLLSLVTFQGLMLECDQGKKATPLIQAYRRWILDIHG
jgi:hypothetical protein